MDATQAEVLGALIGAIAGALGASIVALWTLRTERRAVAHEALLALTDEVRFNAKVIRHRDEHVWEAMPSALERQAFDAALPVLHVLPPELRDDARDVRAKVLFMIYLEEMHAMSPAGSGAAPKSMAEQRQWLVESLPEDLDRLAATVEAFIASRSGVRLRSNRFFHHSTSSGVR